MGLVAAQAIQLATRAVRALEGIDKSLKVLADQGRDRTLIYEAAWSKKGRDT